jgi:hypothetical protein
MTEQRITAARALATRAVSPDQIKAVQQKLIESIQTGTLPSYGGVPILEDLTRRLKMISANQALQQAQAAPQQTIKQQVMDAALQRQQPQQLPQQPQPGLDQLQSNLPAEMAGGGIVAFDEGGEVDRYQNRGLVESFLSPTTARMLSTGRSLSPEEEAELARREQGPGLIDRLLGGMTIQGPLGPLRVPLVSPTTREALQTGQAPIPDTATAAPAAEPTAPVAPRTPGGPTRFDRPSLLGLLSTEKTAGVGMGGGAPSFQKIVAPQLKFTEANLPTKPIIPNFTAGLTDFDPNEYRAEIEQEAKKLEESQQPFLTAQKERMQKREARIEKEEKQAPWMSLIRAGLSTAQSTKPFGAALAEGATKGIDDLITAKAAMNARKEKLDDLREEQARFQMNLSQGNRREARENATNIRSLQNQADQLGLTARTATANLTQQQYGTDVTAALAQQREGNQFAQQQAQLQQGAGIANLTAGLQAQQIAQSGANARMTYELGKQRLQMEMQRARTGDSLAQVRMAQVQARVRNDFETVIRGDAAFQKRIKNMPPNQQQIEKEREFQRYSAQALPMAYGELGIPTAESLMGRSDISLFGTLPAYGD